MPSDLVDDGPTDQQQQLQMMATAVGLCIASWAHVELHMSLLFRQATGMPAAMADAVFATPRAFEVRNKMLHTVVAMWLKNDPTLPDWNLIFNHMLALGGKRNKIAHSTTLMENNEVKLEPYFVLTQDRARITLAEVHAYNIEFEELDLCLSWFGRQHDPEHPMRRPEFATSVPDLLLRLRTEDAQKREAQRHQQQSPRPA